MSVDAFVILAAGVLGALVGSFANVVVFRLPAGRSVVRPRSSCPHCGHTLGPLELVPIVSWIALRGRCASCGARISVRYPLVEAWMAGGFALLAALWPVTRDGATAPALMALFAIVTIASLIDADTTILPDVLTLPGIALALGAAFVYAPGSGLPGPGAALFGALVGAGVLTLINRIGSLVLRRFADTRERLWPVGFDQVNVAAVAGAVGGLWVGVLAGAASLLLNLVLRRPLRLPEGILYAAWAAALAVAGLGVGIDVGAALGGSVAAAGAWALLGAIVVLFAESILFGALLDGDAVDPAPPDRGPAEAAPARDPRAEPAVAGADEEPIAMGFGDAKLAALLGAVLGWPLLLIGVFLAVVLGAVGGVVGRFFGGDRMIPFGPYLALGGFVALLFGDAILGWYLGLLLG